MLEGIKVLSENTVDLSKCGIAITILSCFGLIVCIMALFAAIDDQNPAVGILAIIAGFLMVFFITVGISDWRKETSIERWI